MMNENVMLKERLFSMVSPEKKQFLLFLMIGGLNTLFGYGLFAAFIFLKCHYTVAVFLSTVLGVIFNFFTTGRVVFKNNKNGVFFKFVMAYGMLYFLNIAIITLLNRFTHNLYFNGAVSIAVLAIIAFFVNKYCVFNRAHMKSRAVVGFDTDHSH